MDTADENPAVTARRLMRRCDRATLSTLQRDAEDWPCGSLVLVALDHAAGPILLISELAEHTRNIARDDRVSLLFDGTAGLADPLAGPRITVFGRARKADTPELRGRFLARHPSAQTYADFKDFHLFRVRPTRGHLVAGFGKIHWIEGGELGFDATGSAALVAKVLLGRTGEGWRMTGCDPEGIDLRRDAEVARLDFDLPVGHAEAARAALVSLAKRARRQVAG